MAAIKENSIPFTIPSYISLYETICVESLQVIPKDGKVQIKITGDHVRTMNHKPDLRHRFSIDETFEGNYRENIGITALTLNADDSLSITHYWYSRAFVRVRGPIENPTLKIDSEVLEHRLRGTGLIGYDVIYKRVP